jgi:flagellar hook-length control protein FliK
MPAATNHLKMIVTTSEAPGAPGPSDPDLFAMLLAGGAQALPGVGEVGEDAAPGSSDADLDEDLTDASVLLPLLDQQRTLQPIIVPVPQPEVVAAKVTAEAPLASVIARPGLDKAPAKPAPRGAGEEAKAPPSEEGVKSLAPLKAVPQAVKTAADPDTAGPKSIAKPAPDQPIAAAPATATETASTPEKQGKASSPQSDGDRAAKPDPAAKPVTAEPRASDTETTPAPKAPAPATPVAMPAEAVTESAAAPLAAQVARELDKPKLGSGDPAKKDVEKVISKDSAAVAATGEPARAASRTPELATPVNLPPQDQPAAAERSPALAAAVATQQINGVAAQSAAPLPPVQDLGGALAARVLDLAKGSEWIGDLARDISRASSTDGTMRFRLAPETLGEMRVEITHNDRGAHIRIHVASEAAQQALADAQPRLMSEAKAQGASIAGAEINLANGHSQGRDAERRQHVPAEMPMRGMRGGGRDAATSSSEPSRPAMSRRTDRFA